MVEKIVYCKISNKADMGKVEKYISLAAFCVLFFIAQFI